MHTLDEIWMNAPADRVFGLAADIRRWPELLPHYRWVRVVAEGENQRTAEMAARRAFFPVKWTAQQRLIPEERRIIYHHVRGVTRGMEVEWRITERDGGTHVSIEHDLDSHNPLLRSRLADWIVGGFFVSGIASRTLQHMRRAAEAAATTLREAST
jgi:ribosome-associated toxin RatA of RatAB toxin-antitoxin module